MSRWVTTSASPGQVSCIRPCGIWSFVASDARQRSLVVPPSARSLVHKIKALRDHWVPSSAANLRSKSGSLLQNTRCTYGFSFCTNLDLSCLYNTHAYSTSNAGERRYCVQVIGFMPLKVYKYIYLALHCISCIYSFTRNDCIGMFWLMSGVSGQLRTWREEAAC